MENVGKKVKEIRKQNKDTLQSLADKIEYDWSNLSKVERGVYSPSMDLLKKIAEVYNIKVSYFFGEDQPIPDELKDKVNWIAFGKEMEQEGLTEEDIREMIKVYNIIKGIGKESNEN